MTLTAIHPESETQHGETVPLYKELREVRSISRDTVEALLGDAESDRYLSDIALLENLAEDPDGPHLVSRSARVQLFHIRELWHAMNRSHRLPETFKTPEQEVLKLFQQMTILRQARLKNTALWEAFITADTFGINYAGAYLGADILLKDMSDEMGEDSRNAVDRTGLRPLINAELGFDTGLLSGKNETAFMTYISGATQSEFEAFGDSIRKFPTEPQREVFAKAFLATEFGDDFGELLLDLANKEDQRLGELAQCLDVINWVRHDAYKIGDSFRNGTPEAELLADRIPVAFIKRTTELLALMRRDGLSEELHQTFLALEKITRTISEATTGDTFSIGAEEDDYSSYRADHHDLSVTARPAANGGSARLGLRVRVGETKKTDVSVRLDYDQWGLSLDIGSSGDPSVVSASQIGIQIGNHLTEGEKALNEYRRDVLGQEVSGIEWSGHHVREAFEDITDVINQNNFADIVTDFTYHLPMHRDSDPTSLETTH